MTAPPRPSRDLSGPIARPLHQGCTERTGRELNAMSKSRKWNDMSRQVADAAVHLSAAAGTHNQIAACIEESFGGLGDVINLNADPSGASGNVPPNVIQQIKRIATPFQGYKTPW